MSSVDNKCGVWEFIYFTKNQTRQSVASLVTKADVLLSQAKAPGEKKHPFHSLSKEKYGDQTK